MTQNLHDFQGTEITSRSSKTLVLHIKTVVEDSELNWKVS